MSVLGRISPLKRFFKSPNVERENIIFRFVCQVTCMLLLGCSILLTASEFFGSPISCMTNLPTNVIETYCWTTSTFTMPDAEYREHAKIMQNYDQHDAEAQVIHPGVYSPTDYNEGEVEDKWTFHSYYQWVVFFLCAQAALMYLPKFLWHHFENDLMSNLSSGFDKLLNSDEAVEKNQRAVTDYILIHLGRRNNYVFQYWFCELLTFVMIICQMFMVDSFLGNQFLNYGTQAFALSELDQEERIDPMIMVFPRMTKCHFNMFGPGGTIETHDSLCILPLNILNEKIFLLQWIWFIMIAVLSGCLLLTRIALLLSPVFRKHVLRFQLKALPLEITQLFCDNASIGDWWLVYMLSRNIDPTFTKEIMWQIVEKILPSNNLEMHNNSWNYHETTF